MVLATLAATFLVAFWAGSSNRGPISSASPSPGTGLVPPINDGTVFFTDGYTLGPAGSVMWGGYTLPEGVNLAPTITLWWTDDGENWYDHVVWVYSTTKTWEYSKSNWPTGSYIEYYLYAQWDTTPAMTWCESAGGYFDLYNWSHLTGPSFYRHDPDQVSVVWIDNHITVEGWTNDFTAGNLQVQYKPVTMGGSWAVLNNFSVSGDFFSGSTTAVETGVTQVDVKVSKCVNGNWTVADETRVTRVNR